MTEYACDYCDYVSTKMCNVKRHMKRVHAGLTKDDELIALGKDVKDNTGISKVDDNSDGEEQSTSGLQRAAEAADTATDSDDDAWNNDPWKLLDYDEEDSTPHTDDILIGRLLRKSTNPPPVASGKPPTDKRKFEVTDPDSLDTSTSKKSKLVDAAVQTLCSAVNDYPMELKRVVSTTSVGVQSDKYRGQSKEVVVTEFTEGGNSVKIIKEKEEFVNM